MESFVPRWLRWIGFGLLGLVALVAVALAALYAVTGSRFRRTYTIADSPVRAASDSVALARGRHLVEAIGKCQECHGADYGGKVLSDDPMFGRLSAPNLTSGRGGIRERSDADLERAIRHGVGPGGRPLIFMPAEGFTVLSDDDLAALLGYLRTVPPVDRETVPLRVGPIARALYLTGAFPLVPAEIVNHTARPPAPPAGVTVAYGEYLATAGGCRGCHGADLAGTGAPDAPDLTKSRLAAWTEADFFRAIREGRRPDGTVIDPEKMPWVRSSLMTDDEIRAVWMYVRSLPGRVGE
jgi:mono/diheme cytochrome c family protein